MRAPRRVPAALALLVAVIVGIFAGGNVLMAEGDSAGGITALVARGSPFVRVCGTQLCLYGAPFRIHGATAYGTYDDPATEVQLALRANLNTLAVVEFETHHHSLADTMSRATWTRVDRFIAAAGRAKLHIVLTLSSYAQSLQIAGITPTRTDWKPYLSFIANRRNTATHVLYKNDPTIAFVQLWGEACYPGESDHTCPAGTSGTAADLQAFYHRSLVEWHALAPNILISTGGFSHLNSPTASGIPWRAIMSDPANPLCEIEVNSPGDLNRTVSKVTRYCRRIGKPWYLAAWSSCYADPNYPFYTPSDASMAVHARRMYGVAGGRPPAAFAAVGSEFWNLRDRGVAAGHCDIGPAYPQTFAVIQNAR